MSKVHVYIKGRVQGVFFRATTREMAHRYGVDGWVKNCPDGSVEAVFEGNKDAVDKIVNWCRKGPDGARVSHIDVREGIYTGEFHSFSIIY